MAPQEVVSVISPGWPGNIGVVVSGWSWWLHQAPPGSGDGGEEEAPVATRTGATASSGQSDAATVS